ncbi:MAG: ATP-binding protein [Gammaproteobacteria bacterium]|nr:ATP-binding protein [Gammaproteobacteria bacterium]
MAEFQRKQVTTLLSRLAEEPHAIIAVFGPRQTGKSTLVRQALRQCGRPNSMFILDAPTRESDYVLEDHLNDRPQKPDFRWLVEVWREARKKADTHPKGFVLVLDEIQVIPDWSSIVKGLWDEDRAEDRNLHVVILGSAPLLIQSGLSESLTGRIERLKVSHWSFPEMAQAFDWDLQKYVYFGGYPGSVRFINEEVRWKEHVINSIIEPITQREFLAMTRVRKPALLQNVFTLATQYSGQILAYSKMLGQLHDAGNATTLANYLSLLATVGAVGGLQKYSDPNQRIRASSPKLLVYNNALMSVNANYTFESAQADRSHWGRLTESAVGAHILNSTTVDIRAYYWRESPYDVDFVLTRGPHKIAIEVTSGRKIGKQPGLNEFQEKYKADRVIIISEKHTPLVEFLSMPLERWFDNP